jgi:microcystin-dependent protein
VKYNQPFDQPGNPDAAYTDGNPTTGQNGSIPPAASIEYPQRELTNFIIDSGLTPTNSDLHQLSKSVQSGAVDFGIDGGTADALSVVLNPAPNTFTVGMTVRIKKGASANATTAPTLNIGLGFNTIKRSGGSACAAGDIPANSVMEYSWDGSFWQLTNFQGFSATNTTVNTYTLNIPYCVDTSGTPNTITAPFSPALTSLSAGDMIKIKLANSVTGATAVHINAMSSLTMVRLDESAIRLGDAVAGQILILEFDGTNLQLANPASSASFVPGCIYDWPLETPPSGTFECDGSSKSTTTFARLFGIIGYTFGGAGAAFNVPERRGEFVRGWNHGRGTDPDAATRLNRGDGTTGDHVGTYQTSGVGAFTAGGSIQITDPFLNVNNGTVAPNGRTSYYTDQPNAIQADSQAYSAPLFGNGAQYPGPAPYLGGTVSMAASGGAAETRPLNVNTMYVIAY